MPKRARELVERPKGNTASGSFDSIQAVDRGEQRPVAATDRDHVDVAAPRDDRLGQADPASVERSSITYVATRAKCRRDRVEDTASAPRASVHREENALSHLLPYVPPRERRANASRRTGGMRVPSRCLVVVHHDAAGRQRVRRAARLRRGLDDETMQAIARRRPTCRRRACLPRRREGTSTLRYWTPTARSRWPVTRRSRRRTRSTRPGRSRVKAMRCG